MIKKLKNLIVKRNVKNKETEKKYKAYSTFQIKHGSKIYNIVLVFQNEIEDELKQKISNKIKTELDSDVEIANIFSFISTTYPELLVEIHDDLEYNAILFTISNH